MYLYETHMHTYPVSACAAATPAEQVRAYHSRGYAGIIVTDHFVNGNSGCPPHLPWERKMEFFTLGYELAKREGGLCGLDVFFGLEYNVDGAEFLTYGLSPDFLPAHPGLDKLTVGQYSALVRENGGYLAQAHPYRRAYWIKKPGPVEPGLVDGFEVYNAGNADKNSNRQALEYARLHGLPMQSGSDSHDITPPFSSGITLQKKAATVFDIIEAIKSGQAGLILPPE